MQCCLCTRYTSDPVYIGTIKCWCKAKLCIGRCCKEFVLSHFESIGACVKFIASVHIRMSKESHDRMYKQASKIFVDISGQYDGDLPNGDAN